MFVKEPLVFCGVRAHVSLVQLSESCEPSSNVLLWTWYNYLLWIMLANEMILCEPGTKLSSLSLVQWSDSYVCCYVAICILYGNPKGLDSLSTPSRDPQNIKGNPKGLDTESRHSKYKGNHNFSHDYKIYKISKYT